ncbi:hypothetical protein [Nocardioides sp. 503]|uniref:hypothetical protein n=1 Tax=Nocardioides sp. 503 TaxID=2508326 RepID=UPI00107014C8|nr:hypothetical protein [Nocardioides sp. 503]
MPFTGIEIARLREEVGTVADDDQLLAEVIKVSLVQLLKLTEDADDDLPDEVFDQAHLAVAVDMFNRRKAPNGVLWQQFDEGGAATPLRLSSDPLGVAYPILSLWLVPAIG